MYITTFLILLLFDFFNPTHSLRPKEVRIGGLFSLTNEKNQIDISGSKMLAASMMALRELNNKTDGIYDNILPETEIKYTIRDPRDDNGMATVEAFYIAHESFNFNSVAGVIGATYSSSSIQSQFIFRLEKFRIPQISYSSSSAILSNPTFDIFARTFPSDIYQTKLIVKLIQHFNYKNFNMIGANDDYSITGLDSLLFNAKKENLNVGTKEIIQPDTNISSHIIDIKNTQFGLNVIFAQLDDMIKILFEADRHNILRDKIWIVSETGNSLSANILFKSTHNINKLAADYINNNILRGLFVLSPSNGIDSDVYNNFINRWSKQAKTANIHLLNNQIVKTSCSTEKDSEGNFIWIRKTGKSDLCVGHDFSLSADPICNSICKLSSIELYEPFAYDATISMAMAIHNLIEKNMNNNDTTYLEFKSPTSRNDLYDEILNINYIGITGNISFDSNGDRDNEMNYFIFNYNNDWYWYSTVINNNIIICNKLKPIFECFSQPIFNTLTFGIPIEPIIDNKPPCTHADFSIIEHDGCNFNPDCSDNCNRSFIFKIRFDCSLTKPNSIQIPDNTSIICNYIMPNSIEGNILTSISIIISVVAFIIMIYIIHNRNKSIIKYSMSIENGYLYILLSICFGTIANSASYIYFTGIDTEYLCMVRPITIQIPISLICSCLYWISYYLWKYNFNKKIHIKTTKFDIDYIYQLMILFLKIFSLIFIDIIFHIIRIYTTDTFIKTTSQKINNFYNVDTISCINDDQWIFIVNILKIIYLLITILLVQRIKARIDDSNNIKLKKNIINIHIKPILYGSIMFLIMYCIFIFIKSDFIDYVILYISCIIIVLFLFVPIFYTIILYGDTPPRIIINRENNNDTINSIKNINRIVSPSI